MVGALLRDPAALVQEWRKSKKSGEADVKGPQSKRGKGRVRLGLKNLSREKPFPNVQTACPLSGEKTCTVCLIRPANRFLEL
jgi:hypothetical protein